MTPEEEHSPTGILGDVRVLDLAVGGAGSLAAALLADFGADVIKVIESDPRRTGGDHLPEWLARNRGKRLATAGSADGAEIAAVQRLARTSDLIVADSDDALARVGLHRDELATEAVVLWVPPYLGETPAPWHDGRESAELLEAITGLSAFQASYSGDPVTSVYPHLVSIHALWAATCAVAALVEYRHSKTGQIVSVSGFQAASVYGDSALTRPLLEPDPDRGIGPEGLNPMYTRYEGSDGEWLFVGGLGPKFARLVLDAVDLEDLLSDPRIGGRVEKLWAIENSRWVLTRFQATFRERSAAAWVDLLEENGIPCVLLGRREEWLASPQMKAMDQHQVVIDPVIGPIEMVGAVVDSVESPAVVRATAEAKSSSESSWLASAKNFVRQRPPRIADARRGPLNGLRAAVFGSFVAGPFVGRLLADLGMETVKVEPPHGDPWRMQGFGLNRGFKSIAIDLRDAQARDAVQGVLSRCDVVVDNFRVGVTDRLGIDHDALARLRPGLVTVSVTAYGERGPLAHKPGYDPIAQAISGMMRAQGGDSEPVAMSLPPNDHASAVCGAFAAVLGIYHLFMHGEGRHLSTSLATTAAFLQSAELVSYTGRPASRVGGRDFVGASATDRYYRVRDGHVRLHSSGVDPAMLEQAGLPIDGAVFGEQAADEQAAAEIQRVLADLTRAEAVRRLTDAGVPAVPARKLSEVTNDARLHELGLLARFESLRGEEFCTTGRLVDFSRTVVSENVVAAGLGQHTEELLDESGLSPSAFADLVARDVVVVGPPIDIVYLPPYR